MKDKPYLLEIYEPGSSDVIVEHDKETIIKLFPFVDYLFVISDFKRIKWTTGTTTVSIKKTKEIKPI